MQALHAARALNQSAALRARIDQSRTEYLTLRGERRILWNPEVSRIERVVLKNARGHAYFEYGEPMLDAPVHVKLFPLESMTAAEREQFEGLGGGFALWPEVGSRMMTRVLTEEDMLGKWVIVQEGTYRYAVLQEGGIRMLSVLSEYLATEIQWED
jgi:hypothetical protein